MIYSGDLTNIIEFGLPVNAGVVYKLTKDGKHMSFVGEFSFNKPLPNDYPIFVIKDKQYVFTPFKTAVKNEHLDKIAVAYTTNPSYGNTCLCCDTYLDANTVINLKFE
jgi:hypothetical protein